MMGALRRVPRRLVLALVVLGLATASLAWWACRPDPVPRGPLVRQLPRPDDPLPAGGEDAARLHTVGEGLRSVQLGMRRTEVEALVGRPEPKDIDPVDPATGRFRTRYTALLTEPLPFAPTVRGYCEAVLEYDAAKPGHPLVRLSATARPAPPGLGRELPIPM